MLILINILIPKNIIPFAEIKEATGGEHKYWLYLPNEEINMFAPMVFNEKMKYKQKLNIKVLVYNYFGKKIKEIYKKQRC